MTAARIPTRRTRTILSIAFPVPLALSVLAIAGAFLLSALSSRSLYYAALGRELETGCSALARVVETARAGRLGTADALLGAYASDGAYRVTLVDGEGRPEFDSVGDVRSMENHSDRPEIAAALAGNGAISMRPSPTVGTDTLYAAVPVRIDGSLFALRLALSIPSIERELLPANLAFLSLGLAALALSLAASASFSKKIARPVAMLADMAESIKNGADAAIVQVDGPDEIARLAASLAAMAERLKDEAATAKAGREEVEAVLDALGSPVLVLDGRDRILKGNAPASEFARAVSGASVVRLKTVLETFRSSALAAFVSSRGERMVELEFGEDIPGPWLASLAPFGTVPSGGDRGNAVLVLTDASRLRRLERVRRDFVANVSHELRTPITIITGYAETLADLVEDRAALPGGTAGNDAERRAIAGIERNAARLASIVSDLLTLAALEGDGSRAVETREAKVGEIVGNAVESARVLERRRDGGARSERGERIAVEMEDPDLSFACNEGLMEQALVNLIDNALKYTGGDVTVRAARKGDVVVFSVADRGKGISKEELGRLFERFYRSRENNAEPGTGLGLAIVKHIARAHGGAVDVESVPGSGSVFSIGIPLARAE